MSKIVLITGCSTGIGHDLAQRLAQSGYTVVATARRVGFFFTQTAGTLITSVMLRGGVFSKWTALTGLAGFSLTSIFFVLAAFVPENYDTAMVFAMSGGLMLLAYHIMLSRKFFQLVG